MRQKRGIKENVESKIIEENREKMERREDTQYQAQRETLRGIGCGNKNDLSMIAVHFANNI